MDFFNMSPAPPPPPPPPGPDGGEGEDEDEPTKTFFGGVHHFIDEGVDHMKHGFHIHGGSTHILKRSANSLWPLLKIIALWLVFLLLQLGLAKSQRCSMEWWIFWASQTLICFVVTAIVVYYQVWMLKSDRDHLDTGMRVLLLSGNSPDKKEHGVATLLKVVSVMVAAGVLAGLLGIGGALIFNPFLLGMGIHPQVTASTAVLMILFSSSCIALSFSFQGMLNLSYVAVFAPIGFAASLLGVTIVGRIVKKTGRASIIIIILVGLISLGTLLTVVQGGYRSFLEIRSGQGIGFKPFCST